MHTPAHVAASLLIWRKAANWKETLAVIAGAILPDASMFLFYGYQKLIGSTEHEIWSKLYFQDSWQLFFDVFNSIPIFLVLAIFAHFTGRRILFLVVASAFVHVLCDFPLHNDDAHRHFLPLTHWRFNSPVSYWDPKHFGVYTIIVELLFAVSSSFYLAVGDFKRSVRVTAGCVLGLYALVFLAGFSYWCLKA